MGRHKLEKTEMEINAQKEKWAKKRNLVRRQNYRNNASYRQSVNARNRESYRRLHDGGKDTVHDCSENIDRIEDFGKTRYIGGGRNRVIMNGCLTVPEMAEALGGYHPIVLYRWHREKKFPRPDKKVVQGKDTGLRVYTLAQSRRLLEVMAKHQRVKFYLNAKDKTTIAALFAAMEEPNG